MVRRFTERSDGTNRRTLSITVWARIARRLGLAIPAALLLSSPSVAQTTDHPGLLQAVAAYEAGDLTRSLAVMDSLPVSLPARDQAFRSLYRGLIHFALGRASQARTAFVTAVQSEPTVQLDAAVHAPSRIVAYVAVLDSVVEVWRSEAGLAEESGNLELARRTWSRVAAAIPSDTMAHRRAVELQRRQTAPGTRERPAATSRPQAGGGNRDSIPAGGARDSVRRTEADRPSSGVRTPADSTVFEPRFDSGRALMLGLAAPGLGHFYTARPARGALVLGAATAALAAGLMYQQVRIDCLTLPVNDVCPPGDILSERTTRPLLLAGIGAAAAITILGALDAHFLARRAQAASARRDDGQGGRSGARLELPGIEPDRDRVRLAIVRLRF